MPIGNALRLQQRPLASFRHFREMTFYCMVATGVGHECMEICLAKDNLTKPGTHVKVLLCDCLRVFPSHLRKSDGHVLGLSLPWE